MKHEQSLTWIIRIVLLLLIFLCGYIFIKLKPIWIMILNVISVVTLPLMLAAFITYLLHPLVEKIQSRHVPKWLAIVLIYVLFFVGGGVILVKGIPHVLTQLQLLGESAPAMFRTYQEIGTNVIKQMYDLPEVFHDRIETILAEVEAYFDQFIEKAIEAIRTFINSLFILLIIPFLVFYLLKDMDKVKTAVWYFTPKKWRNHGHLLLKEIDLSLGQYIRGQILVISILIGLAALGFWIIGLPYPILLGMIVGLTEIIPYFGPFLGAIPAVFIAMTISYKMVLWVLGLIILLQLIEGNVLSPFIVGKSLRMHPIMIILALLVGGEVAGVIGMIMAVPVFAVIRVIVHYVHNYKVKH